MRGIGQTEILSERKIKACSKGQEFKAPVEATTRMYVSNKGWDSKVPIYQLEKLLFGHRIAGPAIIMNQTSTCVVEDNASALITESGDMQIDIAADPVPVGNGKDGHGKEKEGSSSSSAVSNGAGDTSPRAKRSKLDSPKNALLLAEKRQSGSPKPKAGYG